MNPNDPRLRALAELVHQLRPAWNRAGIHGAIHAATDRPIDQLVRAAIDAALDPDAQTPAVIQHRDGAAWDPRPAARRASSTPWPPPIHILDLGQPADDEVTRLGAAAARAALRHTQELP